MGDTVLAVGSGGGTRPDPAMNGAPQELENGEVGSQGSRSVLPSAARGSAAAAAAAVAAAAAAAIAATAAAAVAPAGAAALVAAAAAGTAGLGPALDQALGHVGAHADALGAGALLAVEQQGGEAAGGLGGVHLAAQRGDDLHRRGLDLLGPGRVHQAHVIALAQVGQGGDLRRQQRGLDGVLDAAQAVELVRRHQGDGDAGLARAAGAADAVHVGV